MRTRRLAVLLLSIFAATASVASAQGGPIMPLSQVQPGMNCTAETVVQGTAISSFDVQVIDTVQQSGQGARILVSVSGPAVAQTGIAEGFSGSPVYCPDATGTPENIGAISEGVGEYGNNVGLVTPIQQMLGEPVLPPASAPVLIARTRQLASPLTVSGLSPSLSSLLVQAGAKVGRQIAVAPSAPFLDYPVQPLVPGASVAASYAEGAITLGAIGTVTYTDGPDVYAFGHELDGAGRRSLLLQDAYVYDVIANPDPALDPSYKLASPGHTEGTLTSDTPNAVIGVVGPPPVLIPVNVTATDLDTHQVLTLDSQVADETDIGFPLGTSLIDMVAPLEVAQAATQVLDGPPADESGSMCFEISLKESPLPLRFCNRYVGIGTPGDQGETPPEVANGASTDVTSALGLLDDEGFAQLHVTQVSAQIELERGLAQAQIVSALGPATVRPGRTVRVHLLVRVYRGPLETIIVPVRIPRDADGFILARIKGPSLASEQSSSGGLGAALSAALGGSTPTVGSGPASMSALRSAFAAVGKYDGLELSVNGGREKKIYRDPNLLILGSAPLAFQVDR